MSCGLALLPMIFQFIPTGMRLSNAIITICQRMRPSLSVSAKQSMSSTEYDLSKLMELQTHIFISMAGVDIKVLGHKHASL